MLNTPVLFLIFNRPETTRLVFEQIRIAKPRQLFVAADGPRADRADDSERCQASRSIVTQIDWECELHTDFRDSNSGLKTAISRGVEWFLGEVGEGIILEDDCVPRQSFFRFCQELLERYRHDERVMMISGSNFQFGRKRGEGSYYFSRLAGIWGWATWKRAWSHFDGDLKSFPVFQEQGSVRHVFPDRTCQAYWLAKLEQAYRGRNTWGFAWAYALFAQNGLCICPNVNLVANIGFGPGGVHAIDPHSLFANMATAEITEMVHPRFVLPDRVADTFHTKLLAKEQSPYLTVGGRMVNTARGVLRTMLPAKYRKKLKEAAAQYRRYRVQEV